MKAALATALLWLFLKTRRVLFWECAMRLPMKALMIAQGRLPPRFHETMRTAK